MTVMTMTTAKTMMTVMVTLMMVIMSVMTVLMTVMTVLMTDKTMLMTMMTVLKTVMIMMLKTVLRVLAVLMIVLVTVTSCRPGRPLPLLVPGEGRASLESLQKTVHHTLLHNGRNAKMIIIKTTNRSTTVTVKLMT